MNLTEKYYISKNIFLRKTCELKKCEHLHVVVFAYWSRVFGNSLIEIWHISHSSNI